MRRITTLTLVATITVLLAACDTTLDVNCDDNGAGNPAQTYYYCQDQK